MKTKIIFILFVMVCFFTKAMAQYPIPSYNVYVAQPTYFEEQTNNVLQNAIAITEGRRQVNISGQCPTISSHLPCAEVWVFSLDKQDILGPYYLYNDDILQVPIDSRTWGVYIEGSYELDASVWIDDGGLKPLGKGGLKHTP
jgi:hypothetical protein